MENLSLFARMKLFQKAASTILITFMLVMAFVTIYAQMRRSGSTGQDMGKLVLQRAESVPNKSPDKEETKK